MSMATTTFSIATADYNIQQTTHAKQRQHQRGIHRREIQSAVKSHAVATRARDGRKIIQGENGVAVVVSGGDKNIVISTWREANEGDDPTERWNEETEFETKLLLSARVIRMFPFLFPKDGKTKAVPMNDTAVLKACNDYFESSEYGTGGLRLIAYLVATKHEWLNDNSSRHNHLTPVKRVPLYANIIDLLKTSEEIDGNEEVLQLFGERGSQRFWNVLNRVLDDSGDRHLKHKIKELVKHDDASKKGIDIGQKDQFCHKILLQSDSSVARTPEDLADLVLKLSTTCHCIVGGSEWRDGPPPIVTISDYFERYVKGKAGAWKAGDILVKHHKRQKRVMIVGLKEKTINSFVDSFRRIPHCTCSIKTLGYAYWTSVFGEYVDPMAKEGSRTLVLHMSEGSEALVSAMQILGKLVPHEYRRYVSEKGKTVESQPQPQPIVEHADDIYQRMIQESTSIELTDIYRMHAPEKIADIPNLLKKYSGREEKLLKVVRKKYITSAYHLDAVPETRTIEKERDRDEDTTNENKANRAPAKEQVPTWETEDFSAFL
jgi:hypothetical protein